MIRLRPAAACTDENHAAQESGTEDPAVHPPHLGAPSPTVCAACPRRLPPLPHPSPLPPTRPCAALSAGPQGDEEAVPRRASEAEPDRNPVHRGHGACRLAGRDRSAPPRPAPPRPTSPRPAPLRRAMPRRTALCERACASHIRSPCAVQPPGLSPHNPTLPRPQPHPCPPPLHSRASCTRPTTRSATNGCEKTGAPKP